MRRKPITYKVRIAEIHAAYFFIEATSTEKAYKIAEKKYRDKDELDLTCESSHINHTIEVEEAE